MRSRRPSRRNSAASTRASSAARSARAARRRSCCRRTTRSWISSRSSTRPARTASSRTACRTRAARRGSAAASRGRSATRTRSRSGRTTSTRATRTAASAARRWRAPRAPSSTTSSRSPTRSRRSCGRRCSISSRCCSATSASRPSAPRRRRSIVVNGAFTGGGAQADLLRTETHINLNESLAWTQGPSPGPGRLPAARLEPARVLRSHQLRRHVLLLRASTPTPPAGRTRSRSSRATAISRSSRSRSAPTSRTTGRCGPACRSSLGLRYDWQNYFHDNNNVAPRVSVAYAPGNKKTNVLRAGVGVFNDRSGPVVIADVLHSQPGGLIRYVITDPGYPDPFASAAAAAATPPSIVRLAPDVQIPQTLQYSVGLDHQLQKTLTLSITYTGARGYHLFRSRDVNAPPPPLYLTRPDPSYGVIRQVESDRPPGDRFAAADDARQGDALVQRPDAVHAEPRLQRHQRHQLVPGQRLRSVGRVGARRLRSAAPLQPARADDGDQAVRPRRRLLGEHRRAVQRDARARSLQQRPRPRAAGRRAAQQPRRRPASRRSTSARRATSSSAPARTRAK